MKIIKALAAAFAFAATATAHAGLVTFDNEAIGPRYDPVIVGGVQFADSVASFVFIGDFAQNQFDRALSAATDDSSFLYLIFDGQYDNLSLDFGNDLALATSVGDQAVLQLILNNVVVGSVSVDLNRDGLVNQSISSRGILFDTAVFGYASSSGELLAIAELIDNVSYSLDNTVPEPASLWSVGIALAALAGIRRRAAAKSTKISQG